MRRAYAPLLALALAGCVPAPLAPAYNAESVGTSETIIVGRVELVPPLRKGEQRLQGMGSGSYENRMFLLTGERERPMPPDPAVSDYADRIEATLGSHFFVRTRNAPFYILGGIVFLEMGRGMSRARFPGGLRVEVEPGDRAVYIGTLRYHRDEFFEITRVTVVDEYGAADAEFRKKFGSGVPLRKTLMVPAKGGRVRFVRSSGEASQIERLR
jgi:hypothetical protein